jgi:hypothetical protein
MIYLIFSQNIVNRFNVIHAYFRGESCNYFTVNDTFILKNLCFYVNPLYSNYNQIFDSGSKKLSIFLEVIVLTDFMVINESNRITKIC